MDKTVEKLLQELTGVREAFKREADDYIEQVKKDLLWANDWTQQEILDELKLTLNKLDEICDNKVD